MTLKQRWWTVSASSKMQKQSQNCCVAWGGRLGNMKTHQLALHAIVGAKPQHSAQLWPIWNKAYCSAPGDMKVNIWGHTSQIHLKLFDIFTASWKHRAYRWKPKRHVRFCYSNRVQCTTSANICELNQNTFSFIQVFLYLLNLCVQIYLQHDYCSFVAHIQEWKLHSGISWEETTQPLTALEKATSYRMCYFSRSR